jgi:catechol 2,3-dioxygenase-like lactoylglutathione lyase family enzyme
MTTARRNDVPKIFRVTLEVSDLDAAAAFYAELLGDEGKRHPARATTSTAAA